MACVSADEVLCQFWEPSILIWVAHVQAAPQHLNVLHVGSLPSIISRMAQVGGALQ